MRRTWLAATTVAGISTAFMIAPSVHADPGNKYPSTTVTQPCGDDSTVSYAGPLKLWPPNHKYVPVAVTVTDGSGDEVTLATEGFHNQYTDDGSESNGSGHTVDDVNPPAATSSGSGTTTNAHDVRAERSGRFKEGRTYTLRYEATADNGLSQCVGEFTLLVPHDMRGGADW